MRPASFLPCLPWPAASGDSTELQESTLLVLQPYRRSRFPRHTWGLAYRSFGPAALTTITLSLLPIILQVLLLVIWHSSRTASLKSKVNKNYHKHVQLMGPNFDLCFVYSSNCGKQGLYWRELCFYKLLFVSAACVCQIR